MIASSYEWSVYRQNQASLNGWKLRMRISTRYIGYQNGIRQTCKYHYIDSTRDKKSFVGSTGSSECFMRFKREHDMRSSADRESSTNANSSNT